MSATAALRRAVLARLKADAAVAVTRVFDGAAARGTVPFLAVRDVSAVDWGTKDRAGREIRVSVVVRDEGDSGARAEALGAAAEAALLSLPREIGMWRVASAVPVRAPLLNEAAGRWAALIDVRIRMLMQQEA